MGLFYVSRTVPQVFLNPSGMVRNDVKNSLEFEKIKIFAILRVYGGCREQKMGAGSSREAVRGHYARMVFSPLNIFDYCKID